MSATTDGSSPSAQSLSATLRTATAPSHRQVEARLGLPESIANRSGYAACLTRFLALYRPLETSLGRFDGWSGCGIDLRERLHTPRLVADLEALGTDWRAVTDAPSAAWPDLPAFAHALGALYVLEGSTLGGQVIARHLGAARTAGAETCSFFAGRGSETGRLWRSFRDALDLYGRTDPDRTDAVIAGAERTFLAIGEWMDSRHWASA